MEIEKTSIQDLVIIKPNVFKDFRGYFMESYKESFITKNFPNTRFIQDNESMSTYGVLRGLHFQKPPYAQAKLIRVIQGKVLDVAVDLRKKSATYGKFETVILSDENKKQFFIPRGFAHGFLVLSETAIFSYKVDNIYAPNYDSGITFNDELLNIDWQIPREDIKISEKDACLQSLHEFKSPF